MEAVKKDLPADKKPKAIDKSKWCPLCEQFGHCRTTSKKCPFCIPPVIRKKKTAITDANAIKDELAKLDSMPLQQVDDDSDAFFSAASECQDDEEEDVNIRSNNVI